MIKQFLTVFVFFSTALSFAAENHDFSGPVTPQVTPASPGLHAQVNHHQDIPLFEESVQDELGRRVFSPSPVNEEDEQIEQDSEVSIAIPVDEEQYPNIPSAALDVLYQLLPYLTLDQISQILTDIRDRISDNDMPVFEKLINEFNYRLEDQEAQALEKELKEDEEV